VQQARNTKKIKKHEHNVAQGKTETTDTLKSGQEATEFTAGFFCFWAL